MNSISIPLWSKHIFGIAFFIGYEVSFVMLLGSRATIVDLFPFYALDTLFFYTSAYLVFPLADRTNLLVLLVVSIQIIVYLVLASAVARLVELIPHNLRDGYMVPVRYLELVKNIYRAVYILGLSLALWLGRKTIAQAKEVLRLKIINLESDVAYLRAQANPHLLFNMLNYLHEDLIVSDSRQASNVSILSEMMHYAYQPTGDDNKSLLADELNNVRNFLKLQELRLMHPLSIDFVNSLSEHELGMRIPPLLLLTLVDNMIKYGLIDDSSNRASILVTADQGVLNFITVNGIRQRIRHRSPYHIGLDNLRKRLEYTYAGRYSLTVESSESHFKVELSIQL